MKTNVLVIGSGGREHALCWKLSGSPGLGKLYCAPGNGGIRTVAECVTLADHAAVLAFCRTHTIGLVVVGPEQPLVDGLTDALRAEGVRVFGPSKAAAQLEASKAFTKALCKKYHIPTAAYEEFTDAARAKAYLAGKAYPQVVKADGLAAGKGVVIAENEREAAEAIDAMFGGAFGEAGKRVVIEEFLAGEEASFFALADGKRAVYFSHAQDHKRAFDGDQGPNTGGMGTYAPAPVVTERLQGEVMERIILPTMHAMAAEGKPFSGVLFAGLMIGPEGPKLLEYNTRFGDPETQVMLRRLESDLLPVLLACAEGQLSDVVDLRFTPRAGVCVVMAAKGYPGAYQKGTIIGGLERAAAVPEVEVFHAGTEWRDGNMLATGGRVLGITALGNTLVEARANAYRAVDAIDWPEGFCRRDIGWRALESAA